MGVGGHIQGLTRAREALATELQAQPLVFDDGSHYVA
jgi:hypothetical protein